MFATTQLNHSVTSMISVRVNPGYPNHHIWNNHGTWYLHYVIYPTPITKQRIRRSLGTKYVAEARRLRDEFLAETCAENAIAEVSHHGEALAIRARLA
jgi:hypothetical protein